MNQKKTIKNLDKAALRLREAIKKKENIIVYGDADLDGVTAVIICEETIKNLGGRIAALYFPTGKPKAMVLPKRRSAR